MTDRCGIAFILHGKFTHTHTHVVSRTGVYDVQTVY